MDFSSKLLPVMICFQTSELRIFGFFSQLFFLEVEKILVGFKDLRNFYFSSNFPPFLGNLLIQNQGNLDFFFLNSFLSSRILSIGFKEFWIFIWNLPLLIGNLVFQNQGIFDFFFSQQFFEVAISSILFGFKDLRKSGIFQR